MRKRFLLFFPSLIVLFGILGVSNLISNQIPEICFEVELAKTNEEKARGLMFREFLDEDKGMLFIYDGEGRHNFWMKDTLISLDII